MGLSIQPSLSGALPPRAVVPPTGLPAAGPGHAMRAVAAVDQVAFSPVGVLLASLADTSAGTTPSLPAPGSPTAVAVERLLAQRLGALLRAADLPTAAPLDFDVDDDGRVRVAPGRTDTARVQRLVDVDPDTQALVRLLHAINTPPAESAASPAPDRAVPAPLRAAASSTPTPWAWPVAHVRSDDPADRAGARPYRWLVIAAILVALVLWWL